ncbi:MAG TPA: [NiFe]-hydrogenase assembly chaperone HybE [Woeseiaceae bacterium]|mgnify:CR=1 FL=1|nr:[NiFe]-hydrogenase assembly chaperone HybE [Woeseiaceae bacterium]
MADPALERLIARFREAEPRMRDLPFYNERLSTEAVGFRDWEGHRLGILITPWFINLILLPGENDDWSGVDQGDQSDWHLPAETIRFTANRPDEDGQAEEAEVFLAAPVFTNVIGVPDHEAAKNIAEQVLESLLAKPGSEKAAPGHAVSRRDLLRGKVGKNSG